LRSTCFGGAARTLYMHGGKWNLDEVLCKELFQPAEGHAAQGELFAGLGHHLQAQLNVVVPELLDALHR